MCVFMKTYIHIFIQTHIECRCVAFIMCLIAVATHGNQFINRNQYYGGKLCGMNSVSFFVSQIVSVLIAGLVNIFCYSLL